MWIIDVSDNKGKYSEKDASTHLFHWFKTLIVTENNVDSSYDFFSMGCVEKYS